MTARASTVLAVLGASSDFGDPPQGRTALMKKTFLVEMLRPSYHLWWQAFPFERYRYGPYSGAVFHHLDFLIFHGLARADRFTPEEGRVSASYMITPAGSAHLRNIEKSRSAASLVALARDVVWSLQSMGFRTAQDLCRLAYSEPLFSSVLREAQARAAPPTSRIPLESVHSAVHPSFRLQAVLKQLERPSPDPSPRRVVLAYLSYLATTIPAERTE